MELLAFVVIAALVFIAWFALRKTEQKPEEFTTLRTQILPPRPASARDVLTAAGITIEVVPQYTVDIAPDQRRPDLGPIESSPHGWILNPKSVFKLTLTDTDKPTADRVKQLLESMFADDGSYPALVEAELLPIITSSNLRVREVDEYVNKFRPKYRETITRLQDTSNEWSASSERDKQDLLVQFRQKAVEELEVRPECDLETLFECEPSDATIDDALANRYGFQNLQFYLRFASRPEKIHTVPADHSWRSKFEELTEVGLAIRGQDIPLEPVLNKLTLKEMADLVSDIEHPPFTRKAKAVDFLLALPTIRERLAKQISFRELFKVSLLPDEYKHIDLEEISRAWAHAAEVAALLTRTYWAAGWETLNAQRSSGSDYCWVKAWKVENADSCCPRCAAFSGKTFQLRGEVTLPAHIGCSCRIGTVI